MKIVRRQFHLFVSGVHAVKVSVSSPCIKSPYGQPEIVVADVDLGHLDEVILSGLYTTFHNLPLFIP